jgi:hypothetical protein
MRRLFEELRALRGTFGRGAADRKLQLLRKLLSEPIARARDLEFLHDELLFAAAFPDHTKIRAAAEQALSSFARRARQLTAAERTLLSNSGIAGTRGTRSHTYDIAVWLVGHREHVTIDWDVIDDPERLDLLLRETLLPIELELFESGDVSTRQWVELAGGKSPTQNLRWLLDLVPGRTGRAKMRAWRDLYDNAEVQLAWHHGDSPWSISRNRAPVNRTIGRRRFRAPPADMVSHIVTPLRSVRRLSGENAAQWRDACIATLAARGREVSPTLAASLDEIYVAALGCGIDLCILGVAPEDRLPLEANYGYVMFSNGVPIAYGGVTALAGQANTGINLFESFRRSEAAFLFAQTLRAFRTLFGVSRFIINPYQIGSENEEGLQSGAYWFYHRLGFRPRDRAIAALAEAESARNAKRRGRRSSLAALRRLSSSDVVLELPDAGQIAAFEERWIHTVGRAVAVHFTPHAAGARHVHIVQSGQTLCAILTGEKRPLRNEELAGAMHLVPVIMLLQKEVTRWKAADRTALWELVRLKGGAQELPFARASRAHVLWWRTLAEYCREIERR